MSVLLEAQLIILGPGSSKPVAIAIEELGMAISPYSTEYPLHIESTE